MFTVDTFKRALPTQMSKNVNQSVIDEVNSCIGDPDIQEQYLENLISYTSVLREGRYQLSKYFDAVKYVSFKSMGDKNVQAWTKVFPARYARLVAQNASEKDISAHVAMYNKTDLVTKITAQTLIPAHISNAHHFQEAINVQVRLMQTASSEKVQMEAANSLLVHLKQPEVKKVELDVGVKESSIIEELKTQTALLAAQQKELIEGGAMTAKEAAHQSLILEGELAEDVVDE